MRFAIRKKAELEQRGCERTRTKLEGRMFVPAEEKTLDCEVVNLSDSGAGIVCEEVPPRHAFVVLYVDGFGRFEAVAARMEGKVLGLRFVLNDRKRKALVDKLSRFVANGAMDPTSLRAHRRVADSAPAAAFVWAKNGDRFPCEVTDISLAGASLKTRARPPIGEVVRIGRMPARVVRWHERGFAVVFRAFPAGGIEA